VPTPLILLRQKGQLSDLTQLLKVSLFQVRGSPKDNRYVKQLKAFYRCIVENTEPPITGEDPAKVVEVVLTAFKSAPERRPVELPLEKEVVEPPPLLISYFAIERLLMDYLVCPCTLDA